MAAKKRPAAKASKRTPTGVARAAKTAPKQGARVASGKVSTGATPKAGRPRSVAAKKAPSKKAPSKKAPSKKAPSTPRSARGAAAAASTAALREGDLAPSFALPDQTGSSVTSASLAGQPYVLYFYPKDGTPGCTVEACGFRDAFAEFNGVRVLGVSPDSVARHQKFTNEYDLPFTLLSDSERELASAYGVWALKKLYGRETMGIVRSTFLVDGDGVIRRAWRGVRVNGHVPEVQAAAAQLG